MIKMVVCEQKFMNWSETCRKWFLSEGSCGTVLKMGSKQGNFGINNQLTFSSHEICWDQKGHYYALLDMANLFISNMMLTLSVVIVHDTIATCMFFLHVFALFSFSICQGSVVTPHVLSI